MVEDGYGKELAAKTTISKMDGSTTITENDSEEMEEDRDGKKPAAKSNTSDTKVVDVSPDEVLITAGDTYDYESSGSTDSDFEEIADEDTRSL